VLSANVSLLSANAIGICANAAPCCLKVIPVSTSADRLWANACHFEETRIALCHAGISFVISGPPFFRPGIALRRTQRCCLELDPPRVHAIAPRTRPRGTKTGTIAIRTRSGGTRARTISNKARTKRTKAKRIAFCPNAERNNATPIAPTQMSDDRGQHRSRSGQIPNERGKRRSRSDKRERNESNDDGAQDNVEAGVPRSDRIRRKCRTNEGCGDRVVVTAKRTRLERIAVETTFDGTNAVTISFETGAAETWPTSIAFGRSVFRNGTTAWATRQRCGGSANADRSRHKGRRLGRNADRSGQAGEPSSQVPIDS